MRVLFSGASAGGASALSASSGGSSASVVLSSPFAAVSAAPSGFAPGFASAGFESEGFESEGLASFLSRASFLSPFLSEALSDFSAAGSRIATRSLRPSMTTMASGFSVARMPLAAAAQSAGSPLG